MKTVKILFLISILVFNSCKKDETTAPDVTAPPAPTLSSPSNGTTNQSISPILSWNVSSGATSYTLQVSTNSPFSSFVYNQSVLTSTSQPVSGLNNSTKYYWHVNATNGNGTSNWSNTWSFTTKPWICGDSIIYANKIYHTIAIGTQCWLRENLDIGTMIDSLQDQTDNITIEKYCYRNDPSNCATYGGLYQWDEAMQYSTTPGTRGICPSGWHIPTYAEFQILSATVGGDGNALKEIGQGTGTGAGTNTSGFSALLSGYRGYNGYFYFLRGTTYFWSSSEYYSISAFTMGLSSHGGNISLDNAGKEMGFSVRCVKD